MLKLLTKKTLISLFMVLAFMTMTDMAYAADRFLNIAAFQKKDLAYEYDPLLSGNYTQLLSQLEKDNYLLFLNRTVKVQDRDVINLQSNVLRMRDSKLEDGGIDCRFSFDDESDAESAFYSLSGMCYIMQPNGKGETIRSKVVIKRVMLSDPNYGVNVWLKLYEDKHSGIAIFADID